MLGLALATLAGAALGLGLAALAQLARGYPLWGLPGDALGVLLVGAPLLAWLLGAGGARLAWHGARRRAGPWLAAAGVLFAGAAALTAALLVFTNLGQYEWPLTP
jgi:hypothetical protein